MKLFTGMPGTGKTLAIEAIIRQTAEICAEITGVPVEELPPRVLRMTPDKVLSVWLGQSDKNLVRLFEEAIALYDEPSQALADKR